MTRDAESAIEEGSTNVYADHAADDRPHPPSPADGRLVDATIPPERRHPDMDGKRFQRRGRVRCRQGDEMRIDNGNDGSLDRTVVTNVAELDAVDEQLRSAKANIPPVLKSPLSLFRQPLCRACRAG